MREESASPLTSPREIGMIPFVSAECSNQKAIVTAGPAYEPLDEVRRLTNHSTGRLGTELANHLERQNVEVTLLLGAGVSWKGEVFARRLIPFTTAESLTKALRLLSSTETFDAVYHAAAVSDFRFGKIWLHNDQKSIQTAAKGKLSTSSGRFLAELIPTPKILPSLRSMFPEAFLVGWKYEVEGTPQTAVEKSRQQLKTCQTNLSIANGPAYGNGFAVVDSDGSLVHAKSRESLYEILSSRLPAHPRIPKQIKAS